jgi:hypothetical protein
MKKSTVHNINHAVADFKDRTRNQAETKVNTSMQGALRESGAFQEGVDLHDKYEAIRKRNAEAYDAKNFKGMTVGFLKKVYRFDPSEDVAMKADAELARREAIQNERQAKYAEADKKREQIQVRNHEALTASPKKFYAMTYGLLTNIAKKDDAFLKTLTERGYSFDSYDFVEAGFEVQRRLQDTEKKVSALSEQLATLEVDTVGNRVQIEKVLYLLEKLTGEKLEKAPVNTENW